MPPPSSCRSTPTLNLIGALDSLLRLALFSTIASVVIGSSYFDRVASLPCALRQYPTGSVCVCNVTYCDTLEFEDPTEPGEFVLVSSASNGTRFGQARGRFVQAENATFLPAVMLRSKQRMVRSTRPVSVEINRGRKYQQIVGFGGAFTGAVSYNLGLLKPELRESMYRSYYSKKVGIGYSLMRIPIGGSDFDLKPWAYNESPMDDKLLLNFTVLDKRDQARIEQIKELMQVADNHEIKFMGTAWSPPRWMKSNNDWSGSNRLKPQYYQTWADYHIKYLQLIKDAGLDYWAISTGNEPMNAVIGFLFIRFLRLGSLSVSFSLTDSSEFGFIFGSYCCLFSYYFFCD